MKTVDVNTATREEIIKAWVENLESGEFNQGIGRLCTIDDENPFYCCLGVLAETLQLPKEIITSTLQPKYVRFNFSIPNVSLFLEEAVVLPYAILKWLDISQDQHVLLMEMNDDEKDFPTIASYIKEEIL